MTPDEWSELLDDIEAYLDNRADVLDGGYEPIPNTAMRLLSRLQAARKEMGR